MAKGMLSHLPSFVLMQNLVNLYYIFNIGVLKIWQKLNSPWGLKKNFFGWRCSPAFNVGLFHSGLERHLHGFGRTTKAQKGKFQKIRCHIYIGRQSLVDLVMYMTTAKNLLSQVKSFSPLPCAHLCLLHAFWYNYPFSKCYAFLHNQVLTPNFPNSRITYAWTQLVKVHPCSENGTEILINVNDAYLKSC